MQPQENNKQGDKINALVDAMRRQDDLWQIDEIPALIQGAGSPSRSGNISKNTIIILSMALTASVVAAIVHFTMPGTPDINHPAHQAGFINIETPVAGKSFINNNERDKKTSAAIFNTRDAVPAKKEATDNKALVLNPSELNYLNVELNNEGIWFQTSKGTMCYNQAGMICIPRQNEPALSPMVVAMSDNMVNPAYTIPFERNIRKDDAFIPVEVFNHEGANNCSAIFWYRPDDFYGAFPVSVRSSVESKKPTKCGMPDDNFNNNNLYKILYPQQRLNRANPTPDTVKPKDRKPVDWGKINQQMKAIDSQLRIVNEQLKEEGKAYNIHMREYRLKMDSFSRKMNEVRPYRELNFKNVIQDTSIWINGVPHSMNFKWNGDSLFGGKRVIVIHDGNTMDIEIPEVPEMPEMPQMPNIVIPNIPPIPDMKDAENGYRYYYYYDMKKGKLKKKKIKQHGKKANAVEQEINIKY